MPHLRRLTVSLAAGLLLAAAAFPGAIAAGAPSESGIVVRFNEIGVIAYVDPADGLVAATGPAVEQGCLGLGFEDYYTPVQIAGTPPGATVLTVHVDSVPVHVYRASSFDELCGAVIAGEPVDLLGSGTVRFTHVDNDWFGSETRTNAFGDVATGTVIDADDGSLWALSAVWRVLVEPSEGDDCVCRVIREDIVLRPIGN